MVPFPVTFLLTDVLNEFYGQRPARFVTLVAFFMAILAFVIIFVAGAIPIADFTRQADWTGVNEATFANVFLGSQRMLLASLAAFIVAQFVDIAVFHQLKKVSGRRYLWLRASGSTAVSQLIDTVTITFVAWSGVLSLSQIVNIIFSAYGLKILIALGLTPFIYACHALLTRGLGLEPVIIGQDESATAQSLRVDEAERP
jgi:uncharacterized integral membrane protein (TIGR00697 family)